MKSRKIDFLRSRHLRVFFFMLVLVGGTVLKLTFGAGSVFADNQWIAADTHSSTNSQFNQSCAGRTYNLTMYGENSSSGVSYTGFRTFGLRFAWDSSSPTYGTFRSNQSAGTVPAESPVVPNSALPAGVTVSMAPVSGTYTYPYSATGSLDTAIATLTVTFSAAFNPAAAEFPSTGTQTGFYPILFVNNDPAFYMRPYSSSQMNIYCNKPTAPPIPLNLTATAASASQINLAWSASTGATSYKVYRGGVNIASTASTTYPDSGLTCNTAYSYTVKASSAGGDSANSNTASATTFACPPGAFSISVARNSATQNFVSWGSAAGALSYDVYRNGLFLINTGLTLNSTDNTEFCGHQYYYQVRANGSGGSFTWNSNGTVTTGPWACDSPPNTPTLTSPANGSATTTNWIKVNPTFTATVSDPDGQNTWAQFNYSAVPSNPAAPANQNGTTVVSGSSSTFTFASLADGKYDWRAFASDTGGLSSGYSGFFRVKKDTLVPTPACAAASLVGSTITVSGLSGTDPAPAGGTQSGIWGANLQESVNGGAYSTVYAPTGTAGAEEYTASTGFANFTKSGTPGSTYVYQFNVFDAASNSSSFVSCGSVTVPPPVNFTITWLPPAPNQTINPGDPALTYALNVNPQCTPAWVGSATVNITALTGASFTPALPASVTYTAITPTSVVVDCTTMVSQTVSFTMTAASGAPRGTTYTFAVSGTCNTGNCSPAVNKSSANGSLIINEGQWLQTKLGDFYSRGNVAFNPGPPATKFSSDYLLQVGGSNTGGTSAIPWTTSGTLPYQLPTYNAMYLQAGGSTISAPAAACNTLNVQANLGTGVFKCGGTNVTIAQAPGTGAMVATTFGSISNSVKKTIVSPLRLSMSNLFNSVKKTVFSPLERIWEFATAPLVKKALAGGPGALGTAMGATAPLATGQGWNYTMGYSFTPNSNGTITALGGYFSGTKTVNLWNSGGTLLATQSVTCANTWCTTVITPVSVTSGATYFVGVDVASSGGAYFSLANPQIATGITLNGGYYQTPSGSNLALSNISSTSTWYGAADVVFTAGSAGTGALATAMGATVPLGTGNGWNYTMGYSFTPNSNGTISALGGYFSGTKTVKLWNSGGTLLATQSVTCANTWCKTAITPVSVSLGQTYFVGVDVASSGGAYFSLANPQTSTGITLNGGYYQTPSGSNLALSNISSTSTWYGAADVVFSASAVTAPTLTTPLSSSVTATSATLGATLTGNGGGTITARGTCWGTTPAPTTNCLAEGGTALTAYSHSRTALPSSTLIYFRGYATNGTTGYSSDGTFSTPAACSPTSPSAPTQTAPANGSVNISQTGTTLTWTAPASWGTECTASTRSYRVYLQNGVTPPTTLVGSPTEATLSWGTGALPAGSTWYWKIGAVNKDNRETQTGVFSFTVGAVVATPTTVFVNGDLTINDNLAYDNTKMVVFIVNGQIKIKSTVTMINAFLYAENGITTSYDTVAKVSPLVINGGVVVGNGANSLPVVISFNRNTNSPTTTAAEQIFYDPRILTALVTSANDTSFGSTGINFTEANP